MNPMDGLPQSKIKNRYSSWEEETTNERRPSKAPIRPFARVDDTTRQEWVDWVASRPPVVRAVAERLNPWTLYRLKPTGQAVIISSFFEDGTISVAVLAAFNPMSAGDFNVFGVDPNDLEPMPPNQ